MSKWTTCLLLPLLSSCAATGVNDNPDGSAFFLVSKGGVSSIYKMIAGGVDYCKVTQNNLGGTQYTVLVSFDGDKCVVEAEGGSPER